MMQAFLHTALVWIYMSAWVSFTLWEKPDTLLMSSEGTILRLPSNYSSSATLALELRLRGHLLH
jgi:hypothetical protein